MEVGSPQKRACQRPKLSLHNELMVEQKEKINPPPKSIRQYLKTYQDAVWAYMVEHCDLTENGAYFVKFHAKDRDSFERHIIGRWKYGYHRKDNRTNFDIKQKEADATARRAAHVARKEVKKRKHRAARDERMRAKEHTTQGIKGFVHSKILQPVAKWCYNIYNLCLNRHKKK